MGDKRGGGGGGVGRVYWACRRAQSKPLGSFLERLLQLRILCRQMGIFAAQLLNPALCILPFRLALLPENLATDQNSFIPMRSMWAGCSPCCHGRIPNSQKHVSSIVTSALLVPGTRDDIHAACAWPGSKTAPRRFIIYHIIYIYVYVYHHPTCLLLEKLSSTYKESQLVKAAELYRSGVHWLLARSHQANPFE